MRKKIEMKKGDSDLVELAYKTKIIPVDVGGQTNWIWPHKDEGLFHGPSLDWEEVTTRITKYVKNFNVVVQAGGACGMYPKILSKMFDVVYTFEPDSENFYYLNLNCPEKNIIKFNCALGERNGFVSMNPCDPSNRGTGQITPERGIFPMIQIDSLNLPNVDLIYLDIETYEFNALHGATHTIEKFRPVVVCETASSQVNQWFADRGYSGAEKAGFDTFFVPH